MGRESGIPIVIVDHHEDLCRLLARGLDSHPEFAVVGHTTSAEAGAELIRAHRPHLVLADFKRGLVSRVTAARGLIDGSSSALVVHTPYYLPGEREAFALAGAVRCLLKGLSIKELASELRNVASELKHG